MTDRNLTASERHLLNWIGLEFAQYGECHGKDLDRLIELGLAQIHPAGQYQEGFIGQDPAGTRGVMFQAVSLTPAGKALLGE